MIIFVILKLVLGQLNFLQLRAEFISQHNSENPQVRRYLIPLGRNTIKNYLVEVLTFFFRSANSSLPFLMAISCPHDGNAEQFSSFRSTTWDGCSIEVNLGWDRGAPTVLRRCHVGRADGLSSS